MGKEITALKEVLKRNKASFTNVVPTELTDENVLKLDLSFDNKELIQLKSLSMQELNQYIQQQLSLSNKKVAIGGYAENRVVYQMSEHFGSGEEARSVHLGIDIWCDAETPVFSPLDGIIHSFNNNDNFGDYGPTIILEHQLENNSFYTLYGHLSTSSLNGIDIHQKVKKGQKIASIGNDNENGNWPPHLHFQVMSDLMGKRGDFPGVCAIKEMDQWLNICLDPGLILRM
ncbi:peptidoglycan DD-metalloendopeptidase family protein [Carboxylicivirga linearis]|uniref:Peptidoglycan DD-metalloendopeptidase family protein n=1 Tax=Carboxylicivirga linearis TaxID=1628157 RepID=A0ABS5JRJ0_9BACT|nr:peptidoglycan DD-metalloendopeptidase family protein [Carboxylicivirga linearis]MBS2097499.1 peptidoglycan DD-metalloendopeptidase family protein [Carboxylicivirga linearis]